MSRRTTSWSLLSHIGGSGLQHQRKVGLNFISLYTHVQNDNVINTNEQVSDIQNGIQKEVLGLM